MPGFNLPDKGVGADNVQSVMFNTYWAAMQAAGQGVDCVLSGLVASAQGTPDMTVAIAKGSVLTNGILKAIAAGNATIGAADATNPRIDLVVINSSGTIATRAGTAAANPKPAALTANDVLVAIVWIPANDTAINSNQIIDARFIRTQGSITVAKTTSPVTFNTTLVIQTYFTLTLPSGLFLAGRQLEVECGGNYLSNSGTPTWTLTIAYGGTTLFADATGATTADTDRGAWRVRFTLNAQSNTAQQLVGLVDFQTPGAKTAATTGIGDLAATTDVHATIRGTSAVDSDAADRTLTVQWTMSVSNVAVETVMDYARAVLH